MAAGGPPGGERAGRNLKERLREQFCDHPLEHCEDTRLHDADAAYVGDLPTLESLLQEESFQRYGADVDVNHHLNSRVPSLSVRPLTTLMVCPLYISAAYHNLQCFRLLLQAALGASCLSAAQLYEEHLTNLIWIGSIPFQSQTSLNNFYFTNTVKTIKGQLTAFQDSVIL
ncbi:ankyrin repeat and SOCS box protein 1 [Cuculus canorus]|uniref:ankyrin repeat and SOCS box protein 1 n=1 Tax=Cuculus canorus TaxID=55661 RepID=UPI0023AB4D26|nr:ankyrin repeat and SOCS box protein 1 [Cuculus canorus]